MFVDTLNSYSYYPKIVSPRQHHGKLPNTLGSIDTSFGMTYLCRTRVRHLTLLGHFYMSVPAMSISKNKKIQDTIGTREQEESNTLSQNKKHHGKLPNILGIINTLFGVLYQCWTHNTSQTILYVCHSRAFF